MLSQAVERIFPEDDLGPGAIGLGVGWIGGIIAAQCAKSEVLKII